MKYLLILSLLLTSCMTKQRAIRMIDKVQEQYPELLAFDTTVVDTVYCDTVHLNFEIPCDSLIKMLPGDTLYMDSIIYVKDASGIITASLSVAPKPKVLKRTIRQTLKPTCPEYKRSNADTFLHYSGILFCLS